MIIEISAAVIAACFVLILIRLYTLSIRIEDAMRRLEEFLSRTESDIRPVLYDVKNVVSDMRSVLETARHGTKNIDYAVEKVVRPVQIFGILLKAIRIGINTFLKKERG